MNPRGEGGDLGAGARPAHCDDHDAKHDTRPAKVSAGSGTSSSSTLERDEGQAWIHLGDIVWVAREHHVPPFRSAQRHGDIDDIVVTAARDERPHRPRRGIVEYHDVDVRISQQPCDPSLPGTTAPCLRDDPGGHCEGDLVRYGAVEQAADPLVTSL